MKQEKVYCDRCGEEISSYKPNIIEFMFNLSYVIDCSITSIDLRTNKKINEKKDLCQDCYKSFKKWIERLK